MPQTDIRKSGIKTAQPLDMPLQNLQNLKNYIDKFFIMLYNAYSCRFLVKGMAAI